MIVVQQAKYALFPGCNIPWYYPDIEQSIRKTLPALGIELEDIEGYNCCTAPAILPSIDETAWLAVSGRNFTIAEGMGLDIVAGCNGCYSILSHTHALLQDEGKREAANNLLKLVNREYKGTSNVFHVVHALYHDVGTDKIKASLKTSLDNIKVSLEIGCHQLWPSELFQQDDPLQPKILSELGEALGAEVCTYSMLLRCCGGSGLRALAQAKSYELVEEKLNAIKKEADPDIILTSCPSCFVQMDQGQEALRKAGKIDYSIPVFYYTQALALCMGFDPEQVAACSTTPRDKMIDRIING
ncbi:CoB--CoM heterodisulfide reductase iron-sulfur subunit B family protein [Chloroflexota bacterium]